jgi:hypothetical protein
MILKFVLICFFSFRIARISLIMFQIETIKDIKKRVQSVKRLKNIVFIMVLFVKSIKKSLCAWHQALTIQFFNAKKRGKIIFNGG